ncbi:uncharacterized protein LOC129736989 [Falco cherrug]|uniref:uncharacterized protein LOC129736989 n=1 Tax=Falco cherrug TaxID=345164 RepID=UPI00247A4262|nr:uncharacterized protein LOC129736989 [Falco cherrug]
MSLGIFAWGLTSFSHLPFARRARARHCTRCSRQLAACRLSLSQAIAQANLAGIQSEEHHRGKVIQPSLVGSCAAQARPGLQRHRVQQPRLAGVGSSEGSVSHRAKRVQRPRSPQHEATAHQGFPASVRAASRPTPHLLSCQAAAEANCSAARSCCLCFWPGQDETCANALCFVLACSDVPRGTALTLAAAAWHPVPAGERLIPARVGAVTRGKSCPALSWLCCLQRRLPHAGGVLKMLQLLLDGEAGPEAPRKPPRKPPNPSCFKREAWQCGFGCLGELQAGPRAGLLPSFQKMMTKSLNGKWVG